MKRHMFLWKVISIVLGVLFMVIAAGNMLLQNYSAMISMLLAGFGMFAAASVCSWMDDLLACVAEGKTLHRRNLEATNRVESDLESVMRRKSCGE